MRCCQVRLGAYAYRGKKPLAAGASGQEQKERQQQKYWPI